LDNGSEKLFRIWSAHFRFETPETQPESRHGANLPQDIPDIHPTGNMVEAMVRR